MTKSTITRERLEWLSQISGRDDIEDVDGGEIRELARAQLAAMDSETVADDGIYRPGDAVGVFNVGCETCPDHLVAWTVKGQNLPAGNYWLYISQQPAPVVPDGWVMVPKEPTSEMQSAGASAIRIETTAVNKLWTGNAVYRAMLAAADSGIPIISDTWIPVSERMPDDEQEVIVQTHSGWRYVSFYDAHSRLFFDSPDGDIEHILVTHWMPLPAAPQEAK
ncbi:TPA: DUF551 domain-containing protein [Raoultella planticola]